MPYTLAMFFLWGVLLALVGGVIGWALRSLRCRAELARLRRRPGAEPARPEPATAPDAAPDDAPDADEGRDALGEPSAGSGP